MDTDKLDKGDRQFMQLFAKLNDSVKKPEERVHVYRELVTQAAENCVGNEGTSAVAGLLALKDLIRTTGALVDDQKGINNYSNMCLNESDKFVNQSAKWESGLHLDDPMIQKFINDHNKLAEGQADDPASDEDWDRCMSIKIPELKRKNESEAIRDNSPKPFALSNFDLCDDDLMDITEFPEPEKKKSSFDKFSFTREFEREIEGDVRSSWTESHKNTNSNKSSTVGMGRKSSFPPRSAFVDKVWGKRGGFNINNQSSRDGIVNPREQQQSKQNLTPAARNEFRTAGQQYSIDRTKKKEAGGISSSSYGSGRKQLGVKPVSIKSAFKPPIRSSVEDERRPGGSWGQHIDGDTEGEDTMGYRAI